jgi:all-trans-retinol 13,14-reductase
MAQETAETEPDESWDAVVVGSGPGGLTAAACNAAAGSRVLVVERHDLAGGNAQVFRRHHAGEELEFDVGLHYIGDCGPGGLFPSILNGLGVGDRVTFRPLDPDGFDTLRFPDLEFRVPADWDAYGERLVDAFPGDRAGIERCVDTLRTVAEEGRNRLIPGVETPTFDEWAFRTVAELFEQAELSPQACAVLDHWSGLYAGGPRQTAVAMHANIIDHYMRGAFYPEGGGQVIPARLIQVIEAHGGEVRTLSPVEKIRVTDRRVEGVTLSDGTTIDAPVVVSNADHTRTVAGLVDRAEWDPATVDWVDKATMTLGLVCVYVVVDIELDGPNTNYFVFSSYETDEFYDRLDSGDSDEEDLFAYVAMASRKDPDNEHLCPPGHTNFQIMTLAPRGYEYWGVDAGPADGESYRRNDAYRARKQAVTDHLIDAAEQVLGPFRDSIVHVETATPLSQERYTHSTGGTSYGYMHSPEQSGDMRPQHRTEIDGLWLVGANTTSGHGIAGAMVGGVNCAGQILDRGLLIEMMLGTRLAEPETIPADPPDFDPMEWSRGARLRERRAAGRAARAEATAEG